MQACQGFGLNNELEDGKHEPPTVGPTKRDLTL